MALPLCVCPRNSAPRPSVCIERTKSRPCLCGHVRIMNDMRRSIRSILRTPVGKYYSDADEIGRTAVQAMRELVQQRHEWENNVGRVDSACSTYLQPRWPRTPPRKAVAIVVPYSGSSSISPWYTIKDLPTLCARLAVLLVHERQRIPCLRHPGNLCSHEMSCPEEIAMAIIDCRVCDWNRTRGD
jgi:hypothetical protein